MSLEVSPATNNSQYYLHLIKRYQAQYEAVANQPRVKAQTGASSTSHAYPEEMVVMAQVQAYFRIAYKVPS
jgi:hypothetical protein